jgi:hypothetical protein
MLSTTHAYHIGNRGTICPASSFFSSCHKRSQHQPIAEHNISCSSRPSRGLDQPIGARKDDMRPLLGCGGPSTSHTAQERPLREEVLGCAVGAAIIDEPSRTERFSHAKYNTWAVQPGCSTTLNLACTLIPRFWRPTKQLTSWHARRKLTA